METLNFELPGWHFSLFARSPRPVSAEVGRVRGLCLHVPSTVPLPGACTLPASPLRIKNKIETNKKSATFDLETKLPASKNKPNHLWVGAAAQPALPTSREPPCLTIDLIPCPEPPTKSHLLGCFSPAQPVYCHSAAELPPSSFLLCPSSPLLNCIPNCICFDGFTSFYNFPVMDPGFAFPTLNVEKMSLLCARLREEQLALKVPARMH